MPVPQRAVVVSWSWGRSCRIASALPCGGGRRHPPGEIPGRRQAVARLAWMPSGRVTSGRWLAWSGLGRRPARARSRAVSRGSSAQHQVPSLIDVGLRRPALLLGW